MIVAWEGVTEGFDSRCTGCCWALRGGVYQVKVRNSACLVHGGDLEACLRRIAGTLSLAAMLERPSARSRRAQSR